MNNNIFARIIIDIVIAFSVTQGWWFIALPLGLLGCWFFPYYLEIFMAGVAYDSLFGMVPDVGYKGYFGLIISAIGLFVVAGLKRIVRR
jgi:hypothetical protein